MTIQVDTEYEPREPGLGDLVALLWRNLPIILGLAFLCGVLGYVYGLTLPTRYEATATVIFPKDSVSGLLSTFGLGGGGSGPSDKTQALPMLGVAPARQPTMDYAGAILESRSAAEEVAERLDLKTRWGQSNSSLVVKRLQLNLNVQRLIRENKMVIAYQDHDKELAQKIVQEFLDAYDRYTEEHSLTAAARQRKFVESQLAKSEKELESSRKELVRFESDNPTEVLESQPDAAGRLFTTLVQQQMDADGKMEEARSLMMKLREKKLQHASALLGDHNSPPPKDDPLVADLQQQLLTAQLTLDNLRLTRTDEHPDVIAAKEQLGKVEGMLDAKISGLQNAYADDLGVDLTEADAKYAAALARKESTDQMVDNFNARTRALPGPGMSYQMLKRRFTMAETMNRALQLELQRALITESLESVQLEVLDPPKSSDKPVYPRKGRLAISCAMLGFLVGCGWVLLRRSRRDGAAPAA